MGVKFKHKLSLTKPEMLKVGDQLPELPLRKSLSCNDLVEHDGKYYLAFRSASGHYPSINSVLYILSSKDCRKWAHEHTIFMDADLREPRFLSFKGKLSLYFFMGSIHTFKFIPKNIYCIQKKNGKWQQPAIAYKEGFVPWRIRIFNGKAYMSIYYGKEIYHKRHNFAVHLLESSNGKDWQQITKDPQITRKGATETEFEFDDDGNIYGTVRLEGYGSLVFHAPKDDLGNWKTRYNYFKHDSALLLKHENELYLISRKNSLGPADISPPFMPDWFRAWHNMIQYSLTPKRTAIYHFNKEQLRIRGLKTLPSRGDTGFPSVMKLDKNRYFLLNYSSNLRLPINIPWIFGQFANTNLYSQELRFGRT